MKVIVCLAATLSVIAASSAAAQHRPVVGEDVRKHVEEVLDRSGIVAAVDSVKARSTPEMERALRDLGMALSGLASRIAEDPQLRSSALQAASGMLGVAQVVVEEHSSVVQEVLRTTADELERRAVRPRADPDPR